MPFDPTKPFEVVDSEGGGRKFDPSLPFENYEPSRIGAIGRGFSQGLTAGFADEAAAGTRALYDYLTNKYGGEKGLGDIYGQEVAESRAKDVATREEFPWTMGAAEVAGAVAPVIGATLLSAPAGGSGGVAAGAGTAARILSPTTVRGMAALGGVAGLGYSEAKDVGGMAGDVARGAAFGAVGGKLGQMAGKAIPAIASAIKGAPETLGSIEQMGGRHAVGATKRFLGDPRKARQMGSAIDVALEKKIITPASNIDDMLRKTDSLMESSGEIIGNVGKELDNAGVSAGSRIKIGVGLDDYMRGELPKMGIDITAPNMGAEAKAYSDLIETIAPQGADDVLTFEKLQFLKNNFKSKAKFDQASSPSTSVMYRKAYEYIRDVMDDAIESGADSIGNKQLLGAYRGARRDYGAAKTLQKSMYNRWSSEQGNSALQLREAMLAAGGLASGNIGPAAGLLVGKRGLEAYGGQAIASGARAMKPFAQKVSEIIGRSPEVLGEYAPVLQAAARRGGHALATTHYILQQQDRNYAKIWEELDKDNKEQ